MSIEEFNKLSNADKKELLITCGGSSAWADKMLEIFPVRDIADLQKQAKAKWTEVSKADWLEAFSKHPKIGDIDILKEKLSGTAAWASAEQAGVNHASEAILHALAKGNKEYEAKFGYIFIVFANGKSAIEMLNILQDRLPNSPDEEFKSASAEQVKITNLRLEKLFA